MALDQYKTQVLLLHSQQSTLDSLSTGFGDKFSVHVATSGTEALNIFNDTPVHIIVSAQELPGMSGLDALREARKRSPDTIGILLAGSDQDDGLEALVGEEEVFQIVRGEIAPEALCALVESATQRARLMAIAQSANDTTAAGDDDAEHIVMETSENGSTIISDGTGQVPALKPQKISVSAGTNSQAVDVLVLSKDEEFLATIKDSSRGLHNVHHAVTPTEAEEIVQANSVGVLVTDAAMVGSNIEVLTQRLRRNSPRLVAVVAGRRDDGELLMDLINRGQVYRFLLKPVSPGRARLAIEASVKHHLEAADKAFKGSDAKAAPAAPAAKPTPTPAEPKAEKAPAPAPKKDKPKAPKAKKPAPPVEAQKPAEPDPSPITVSRDDSLLNDSLGDAFEDDSSFTETMTGIAVNIGKKISSVTKSNSDDGAAAATPDAKPAAASSEGGSPLKDPKMIGMAAGGVLAVIAVGWFMMGSDEEPAPAQQPVEAVAQPTFEETDIALPAAQPETPAGDVSEYLERARAAYEAGNLIEPDLENAIELYVAARDNDPDNTEVATELGTVVDEVVGVAETAILQQRLDEASLALQKMELADPGHARLAFLNAQLDQLQLRSALDEARAAIRDGRFEDAGAQIVAASAIVGGESPEIQAIQQDLAAARSEQQVDEVLALANERLEQDQLISPSNDNARYYYELALSGDPDNTAARQGLGIVASKLVLQARTALDAGQLVNAEDLLRSARALDPENSELAAVSDALNSARDERVAAEAKAEEQRQAELRAAEEQRVAEEAEQERLAAEAAAAAAATATVANNAAEETAPEQNAAADTEETAQPAADESTGDQTAPAVAAATVAAAAGADDSAPSEPEPAAQEQPPAEEPQAEAVADNTTGEIPMVPVSTLTRINYVAPKYPRNAQRRSLTGSVDVAFTVRSNGTVDDIEILDSTPSSVFDEAAMEAVSQWRFEPSLEDGEAVEKRTAVRLAFNLQ